MPIPNSSMLGHGNISKTNSAQESLTQSIKITLRIVLKESVSNDVSKFFAESARVEVGLSDEQKSVSKTKADYTAPNTTFVNYDNNDRGEFFEFLREAGKNGYVLKEGGAAYVELQFKKGEDTYTAYFFMEYVENYSGAADENGYYRLRLYANNDKTGEYLECDAVTNGYTTITEFNNWVQKSYEGLEDFDVHGWSLQTRVIVDDDCTWLFDGAWSAECTCPEASADDTAG